jgi:hypothetical protein
MNETIMHLLAKVIGDARENPLEHRLFNSISLLNGIANIGGLVLTYF